MTQDKFNAIWFDKYREMLQGKIVIYESLIQVCQAVEEVGEEISSSDLYSASASWLGTRGDDDDKKGLHPKILQNKEWLIRLCQELIDLANHEVDELSKLLGQTVVQEITGRNKIREIISNYRSKRRKNESQLTNILGNFIEIAKQEYGILQQEVQGAANEFIKYFKVLIDSIDKKTITVGSLFLQLYKIIIKLDQYHGELISLSVQDYAQLLGLMKGNNTDDAYLARCFVENFHLNEDLIKSITKWAKESKLDEDGHDNGYNALDKDKQKELDKFIQKTLEMLFSECTSLPSGPSNRFKEIKENIKEILKTEEDYKKPIEELEELLQKLISFINERLGNNKSEFKSFGVIDSNALFVRYNNKKISVRDLIKNVKDKDNSDYKVADLKQIVKNLENLVSTHNDNLIDDFMELQVGTKGVLSKNTSSTTTGNARRNNTRRNGGDWYDNSTNNNSLHIGDFRNLISSLRNLIEETLGNTFWDQNNGDRITSFSDDIFNNNMTDIKKNIQLVAYNIAEHSSNGSYGENIKNYISLLEQRFESLNNMNSIPNNKQDLANYIGTLDSLLEQIFNRV